MHEFVKNYTDSLMFRIPLPKVLSINSLSFDYDYTIEESYSNDVVSMNFTSLYLGTTEIYWNFMTVNPYPNVVSHTVATVLGKINNSRNAEYTNSLSEIQYRWDIPWLTILMNLNTQIYLSVSHDNKTYVDYAFDKFTSQYNSETRSCYLSTKEYDSRFRYLSVICGWILNWLLNIDWNRFGYE